MSKREKKRMIGEGVRKLKSKPGWDPADFTRQSPKESLRDLNQASRTEESYTGACDSCNKQRAQQNDATALCEKHLQEAMGFGG